MAIQTGQTPGRQDNLSKNAFEEVKATLSRRTNSKKPLLTLSTQRPMYDKRNRAFGFLEIK